VQAELCSPWNYWHINSVNRGGQAGDILVSFENGSRIRGLVFSSAGDWNVYEGDVGMCCYLRGGVVWWGGTSVYINNACVTTFANPC
jgi:hypothetical protein